MDKLEKAINKYYFNRLINGDKVYYQIVEDKVYLSDSYSISIIDKTDFKLDLNYFTEVNLNSFIESIRDFKYYDVKDYKQNINRSYTLYSDNLQVLIDKKYMKLYENLKIQITEPIKPILFLQNDIIRGFILPIKEY